MRGDEKSPLGLLVNPIVLLVNPIVLLVNPIVLLVNPIVYLAPTGLLDRHRKLAWEAGGGEGVAIEFGLHKIFFHLER